MLALSLMSVHGSSCKDRGLPGGATHNYLLHDLAHIGWQGRKQDVVGPLQDDEALLLFALSRALGVNRVLEIGSLNGDSARNFLSAVGGSKLTVGTAHATCDMTASAPAGALYASRQGVFGRPLAHRA